MDQELERDLVGLAQSVANFIEQQGGLDLITRKVALKIAKTLHDVTEGQSESLAVYIWLDCHNRLEFKRAHSAAQRRARRLLLTYLTPEQQERVIRSREFHLQVGDRLYRISTGAGTVQRIERRGRRWYATHGYCHHDDGRKLPGADVALAHMLMLLADEAGFLAEANETLWDDRIYRYCAVAG